MAEQYLVQVGVMGAVGRFQSVDWSSHTRDSQVVCRTVRGLEVGRVLNKVESPTTESDGDLLRRVTIEDQLLVNRLDKHRDEAFTACQELLSDNGLDAVLVDVEHLFDGQSVFFYFLGEVDHSVQRLTEQLADSYEKTVRFRQFSDTLHEGCGPDCGTENAKGCGSTCSNCAVSADCAVKPKPPESTV